MKKGKCKVKLTAIAKTERKLGELIEFRVGRYTVTRIDKKAGLACLKQVQ